MSVEFHDFRIKCKEAIAEHGDAFLEEAASEIESAAASKTPGVFNGELKGAWTHIVDSNEKEAIIGNPLEPAIWFEMGTGEYALKGNGRKGGWAYYDEKKKKWRFTYGMKPKRMLHNAYVSLKPAIIARAKQIFGDLD